MQTETFTGLYDNNLYKVQSNGRTIDCNMANIIYLITCNECGIQYVGETGRVVRSRLSEHKNGICR